MCLSGLYATRFREAGSCHAIASLRYGGHASFRQCQPYVSISLKSRKTVKNSAKTEFCGLIVLPINPFLTAQLDELCIIVTSASPVRAGVTTCSLYSESKWWH